MDKYQLLRIRGLLHGTIKRAREVAADRVAAKPGTDPLITARDTRPERVVEYRAGKLVDAVPTREDALRLRQRIMDALDAVQSQCRMRLLTPQQVVLQGRNPGSHCNGGEVTSRSYKYPWTTTTARSSLAQSGEVVVSISRSTVHADGKSVSAPWGHWNRVSLSRTLLAGGGVVAIKKAAHWECFDKEGEKVGVAVRVMDSDVVDRFGLWEHGKTVAECKAETRRKAALLAAEKREREEMAARAARKERAAAILVRIGSRTDVTADMALAAGACTPGIAAFADRIGKRVTDTVKLTDLAEVELYWALRIARNLVNR